MYNVHTHTTYHMAMIWMALVCCGGWTETVGIYTHTHTDATLCPIDGEVYTMVEGDAVIVRTKSFWDSIGMNVVQFRLRLQYAAVAAHREHAGNQDWASLLTQSGSIFIGETYFRETQRRWRRRRPYGNCVHSILPFFPHFSVCFTEYVNMNKGMLQYLNVCSRARDCMYVYVCVYMRMWIALEASEMWCMLMSSGRIHFG